MDARRWVSVCDFGSEEAEVWARRACWDSIEVFEEPRTAAHIATIQI